MVLLSKVPFGLTVALRRAASGIRSRSDFRDTMSRTLSRRIVPLEGRLKPAEAPFKIEIEFISAVDGSVTKRLRLGGGAASNDRGRAGAPMPTLPGRAC